jgi:hypothetical protein
VKNDSGKVVLTTIVMWKGRCDEKIIPASEKLQIGPTGVCKA